MKPLRPRDRTPSGHDIPVPESVYLHMQSLDEKIDAVEDRVGEKLEAVEASVNKLSAKLDAGRNQTMVDLAKILIPAVVAIVGGQRLLAPAPEPPRVVIEHTPITPAMAPECMSIQPGTQAQAECFARVQAEIQSGRRPAATP